MFILFIYNFNEMNLNEMKRPTHYFVRSLSSPSDYELDGVAGKGFGHQDGSSFASFAIFCIAL